jgi:hypothetical protein
MNRTDRITSRTSPGPDPVLRLMIAAAAVLAVVLAVLTVRMIGHARAQAAHPCPSWNFPVLTSAGWGCAESLTIGVKSR